MATPSSGTIKFSDLKNEFQLSGKVSLSQFYKGGSILKVNKAVNQSSATTGVPTSGQITLSILRGRYRYKTYTFTLNTGTFSNVGVGNTITDGTANFSPNSDPPGPYPTDIPVYAEATIPSGTTIYGPKLYINPGGLATDRQRQPALRCFVGGGGVSTSSIVYLINNGNIYGFGGDGGAGAGLNQNGYPGFLGGHAIVWGRTTYLENYGTILAGGGGGGGGGYAYNGGPDSRGAGQGGGGGAGFPAGSGGPATQITDGGLNNNVCQGNSGSPGSLTSGGSGGPVTCSITGGGNGGAGGNGGGNGVSGNNGNSGSGGSISNPGGQGGGFGKAVRSQTIFSPTVGSFSVILNSGTISGPIDTFVVFGN